MAAGAQPPAPATFDPAIAAAPALAALRRFLVRHPDIDRAERIGVAFSGGADSTALLLAAVAQWGAARIEALHIDHGLQAAAQTFAQHTRTFCSAIGVRWSQQRVDVPARRGDSVEEQARQARYAALAELAQIARCGVVLLGQHGDDQVESLLLALLRGAGPRGLAAMPERFSRAGCDFARPLLDCGADELRASLNAAGVGYLDDPMNADPAYRRSRIRHELLPAIARLEPGYRGTLGRSAALCAQADALLAEQAAADFAACREGQGLALPRLRALGSLRAAEVIRHWLRLEGLRLGSARTQELVRQIMATADGAYALALCWPQGEFRRSGQTLLLRAAPAGRRDQSA